MRNRSDYSNLPTWFNNSNPTQPRTPGQLLISKELEEHYNAIVTRRDEMLNTPDLYKDQDVTAMLNATTKMLQALVATQEKLYNAETHARFQHIVIEVLKEMDPEAANKILDRLDEALED